MSLVVFAILVAAVLLGMLLPSKLLPSASLYSYALFPVGYADADLLTVVTLPGIFILLWLLRARRRRDLDFPRRPALLTFLVLLGLAISLLGTISPLRSFGWLFAFSVLFLFPLFWAKATLEEANLLRRSWAVLAIVLALFGIVEFMISSNPLFDQLYLSGEYPIRQHWDSYRITTSLGHPLTNMIFFATSFGIMFGWYQVTPKVLPMLALIASLGGVFLTVSRTGVVVCAAVVTLAVLVPHRSGSTSRSRFARLIVVAIGGLGVLFIMNSDIFVSRLASSDGTSSANARSNLINITWDLSASFGLFGSGPGTSNVAMEMAGQSIVLENSFLQLLVSLGLTVTVMIALLLARVFLTSIKLGRRDAAFGLAALAIGMSGFNWLEAVRPGIVLFGLLFVLAFAEKQKEDELTADVDTGDSAKQRSSSAPHSATAR